MTEPQQSLLYQSEDCSTSIDVMLEAETLWLNQKQLTELFGKAKGTISEHIRHNLEDGELTPAATVRLFRTVQHAEQEFDKFRVLDDQRFESDFDRMVQQLPTKKPKG
ncbi:MAG: hypothetical protein WCY67_01730 [Acidithiobacillus sp.]